MYIKDLQTDNVRLYGESHHDSLAVSEDGRTLSYINQQNGDGSRYGDYRFCDEKGRVPEDIKSEYNDIYFNIGGWQEKEWYRLEGAVKYALKNDPAVNSVEEIISKFQITEEEAKRLIKES